MDAVEREVGLTEPVRAELEARLGPEQASRAEEFIAQFYRWVPREDLARRSLEDHVGAALSAWSLMQQREPDEARLRVYNPDPERDGWSSPHTVAEILSDDMPFLVDSVTMELRRQGFAIELVIHPVMRVRRVREGRLQELVAAGEPATGAVAESVMHVEVLRTQAPSELERLRESLHRVLGEVRLAVGDWAAMLEKLAAIRDELAAGAPKAAGGAVSEDRVAREELEEVIRFLDWLGRDHFTFLGYREYDLVREDGQGQLRAREGSALGILKTRRRGPVALSAKALALAESPTVLVLTKANSRSTIHRPVYLDYIGVKRFDERGRVTGERRFLGLYTTTAYKTSPTEIPLVRRKVATVLARAGFPPDSHDAKALLDIMESHPRDSLLQMEADELFDVTMGILGLGERQRLRLFVTRDPLDRFVDCTVCIPRDRFNTENRERMSDLLLEAFGGRAVDWSVQMTASVIARVHYIVRCAAGATEQVDLDALEGALAHATRAWSDDLRAALVARHGEDLGLELHKRYGGSFPPGYRSDVSPEVGVADIDRLEALQAPERPDLQLYRPAGGEPDSLRCKLYSSREIALSDVLPTFENMGTRVVDERPHRILRGDGSEVWIYDFGLSCVVGDDVHSGEPFREAFLDVVAGELEDDGLGALVLAAGLSGSQVSVLRAVARYLRQAGIAFSDAYMQRTLVAHPDLAFLLVDLFEARFNPKTPGGQRGEALQVTIEERIDAVESLDEDRILRSFLTVICATLRTNYFVTRERPRRCLSLKLDPTRIPLLPRPRPRFEIFVYSPRVEGVHLRGGRVARGGLRWSDRPEDFRTEILGLMKAQMVKNALIVPVGSKGGFVVKRPPAAGGRQALIEEAIACYETFLCGMLDLTDNILDGRVVPPPEVVRYDEDDPYLVVAADKGTATFSDIANGISGRYGFWLGDAFASGGSQGYDHKAMGITARGAWESVKRHFRELGHDVEQQAFTVVGVGDMSGDVFGNGMLLSRQIRLVAAFNHLHVFIDPDPDPARSFEERRRLFEMPRSGWDDYDRSLISAGGGIYLRTAKTISLSSQAREALGVEREEIAPNELISAILRAPVDLLWNGGIGTYVKSSEETHAEVGDKANDVVRVDANELRCKVVGEGGNLGLTQLGRIEYAQEGGLINTDAIDNVAGVNCSDHEVNIKILLDAVVAEGAMSTQERNMLLAEMTESVGEAVIEGSYRQTQAMSIARVQAASMIDVHARVMRELEGLAALDREIEYLPSDATIARRKADHQGLLSPELAVLMAYEKIHLYARLLESNLPEDEYLAHDLERYFPHPLPERYREQMRTHRLRREIIATTVANQLVDRMGTTFTFRVGSETGAQPAQLARGFAVAREVFGMRGYWAAVEALDHRVAASVQTDMLIEGRRLVERATRWLVRAYAGGIEIDETIARFAPAAEVLAEALPDVLQGIDRRAYDARADELRHAGVPAELVARVAAMPSQPVLFDLVDVAEASSRGVEAVTRVYFRLGEILELDWLRGRILDLPRADRWQTLARLALRDDLMSVHRELTAEVLATAPGEEADECVEVWERSAEAEIARWLGILGDIRSSRTYDTTTLPVALREVRNLTRAGRRPAASALSRS